MTDTVFLLPVSKKARSRVGTRLQSAIVEQRHHDKIFVVFDNGYCTWMPPLGGDDFNLILDF
jgi:hypothetical protein